MPVTVAKGVDAMLPRIVMVRVVKGSYEPNHLVLFTFNNQLVTRSDVGVVPKRIVLEVCIFLTRLGWSRRKKGRILRVIQGHSNPGGN